MTVISGEVGQSHAVPTYVLLSSPHRPDELPDRGVALLPEPGVLGPEVTGSGPPVILPDLNTGRIRIQCRAIVGLISGQDYHEFGVNETW